jgi:hypothetical protein
MLLVKLLARASAISYKVAPLSILIYKSVRGFASYKNVLDIIKERRERVYV